MSYTQAYNRLAFFEPIMAVDGTTTKPMCAMNIGAANATHGEFVCVVPCVVKSAKFTVTLTAVVGTTTAPYIVLSKYGTPGAGGTATVLGTVTVASGAAVGSAYYKENIN